MSIGPTFLTPTTGFACCPAPEGSGFTGDVCRTCIGCAALPAPVPVPVPVPVPLGPFIPPKACPNGGRGCDCAGVAEGISILLEFGPSEGPGEDLTDTAAIVKQAV